MFFAFVGMSETNAHLACSKVVRDLGKTWMPHKDFRLSLALVLMDDSLNIGVGRILRAPATEVACSWLVIGRYVGPNIRKVK